MSPPTSSLDLPFVNVPLPRVSALGENISQLLLRVHQGQSILDGFASQMLASVNVLGTFPSSSDVIACTLALRLLNA